MPLHVLVAISLLQLPGSVVPKMPPDDFQKAGGIEPPMASMRFWYGNVDQLVQDVPLVSRMLRKNDLSPQLLEPTFCPVTRPDADAAARVAALPPSPVENVPYKLGRLIQAVERLGVN